MSNGLKRIGIFSDIHANLHALQSVLKALEADSTDAIFCCGDIIGYGAHPNECVEIVRDLGCPLIAGNHDHAALTLTDISYFNDVAKAAVLWTKEVLTPGNADFLRNLPLTIAKEDFFFVHGSPRAPEEWNYILTMGDARLSFECFEERFCFIGHSHQPFIIENSNDSLFCAIRPELEIKNNCRYLVNVGSVGQPRDHNPDACYAICDLAQRTLEIKRVRYDVEGAQRAIIDAGLPRELADRLTYGW
jgi:diadenosine tetraphosphatase ApaH/serine/threonine PP2A family protein phosphatase